MENAMNYYIMALPIVASVIFFIVSLILFLKAPKGTQRRKTCKVVFIVSAVILGVIAAAIIGFMVMMMLAIMFM